MTPWTCTDIARIRDMVTAGNTSREIAVVFQRSPQAILRVVKLHNLGPWPHSTKMAKKDCPPDLAERHAEMALDELAVHYGMGKDRIAAFCREKGLRRSFGQRSASKAIVKRSRPRQLPSWKPAPSTARVGWTEADEAARFLQSFGPVYRCTEKGRADFAGRYWRRGSAVLTDAELVERAEYMRKRAA